MTIEHLHKQTVSELSGLLEKHEPLEFGKRALLIDKLFSYRIILGRMPQALELEHLGNDDVTFREFIDTLLASQEFAGRFDFAPPGLRFMSETNGFRFWFNSADREMGARMATGLYEPETVAIIEKIVGPQMRCLDIGAQTGFYSCLMAKLVGPAGHIVAYEPYGPSFEMLQKNAAENSWLERITTRNVAVSDSSVDIRVGITSGMVVADRDGSSVIKAIKIDDISLPKVDFCKIDVEGHEPGAIRGMEQLLRRDSPVILTEVNEYWLNQAGSSSSEYIRLLSDLDYVLFNLEDNLNELVDYVPRGKLENINVLALPHFKVDLYMSMLSG